MLDILERSSFSTFENKTFLRSLFLGRNAYFFHLQIVGLGGKESGAFHSPGFPRMRFSSPSLLEPPRNLLLPSQKT